MQVFRKLGNTPNRMAGALKACFVAAAIAAGALGASATAHAADTLTVVLDRAKVLQLPPNTATIIVGNPVIADVTMLKGNNQMVLTGKAYGQTNMIALDRKGNAVGESIVKVVGNKAGLVVQRGLNRETYSCEPRCQPTLNLGDTVAYSAKVMGAVKMRNAASRPGK